MIIIESEKTFKDCTAEHAESMRRLNGFVEEIPDEAFNTVPMHHEEMSAPGAIKPGLMFVLMVVAILYWLLSL